MVEIIALSCTVLHWMVSCSATGEGFLDWTADWVPLGRNDQMSSDWGHSWTAHQAQPGVPGFDQAHPAVKYCNKGLANIEHTQKANVVFYQTGYTLIHTLTCLHFSNFHFLSRLRDWYFWTITCWSDAVFFLRITWLQYREGQQRNRTLSLNLNLLKKKYRSHSWDFEDVL